MSKSLAGGGGLRPISTVGKTLGIREENVNMGFNEKSSF